MQARALPYHGRCCLLLADTLAAAALLDCDTRDIIHVGTASSAQQAFLDDLADEAHLAAAALPPLPPPLRRIS